MKRSRRKLNMRTAIKTEGEEARNNVVQCSGSSLTSSQKPSPISKNPSPAKKKIQVLHSVTINKKLDSLISDPEVTCTQKTMHKKSNSIFTSPSTSKQFCVLEQVQTNENDITEADSISLDNISISNLIPPLESPMNSKVMTELLSTPKSKKTSKLFSQFNTPSSCTPTNTDGNIQIHQTPTLSTKRKGVLFGDYDDNSNNVSVNSPSTPKQVKFTKMRSDNNYDDICYPAIHNERSPRSDDDIESLLIQHKVSTAADEESDEEIFDQVPRKTKNLITTQHLPEKKKTPFITTETKLYEEQKQLDQSSTENTQNIETNKKILSPKIRDKTHKPPSFEVNVRIEQFSSDVSSSFEDSNLDSEDGSDTFDEIYDSESESSASIEDVDNEGSEEWVDISNTNAINFEQYLQRSQINIPPNIQLNEPLDYYKLFVNKELIEKMVVETNKYAAEYISSHDIKPKSRVKKWVPTTFEEMEKFMGVLMVMGITKLPQVNLYWSKKKCYRNEYIANLISRDRFLLLLKFWHFSDNVDKGDKLYKIRNVLDILLKSFTEVLKPGRFMVIDETMIPWKGRLIFRQYIKNKAHKYIVS
ncbi:uncharacterized protein LOC123876503 [Maniola jurtina]|uniref:uncharacterized protein LOC123876503 n=1 Tax=Maniola jurtina TaxID=191418 RepID=UPI001E68FC42|nr:uncharacterized protein LOC123876503 [Maniola jurtina]